MGGRHLSVDERALLDELRDRLGLDRSVADEAEEGARGLMADD